MELTCSSPYKYHISAHTSRETSETRLLGVNNHYSSPELFDILNNLDSDAVEL
jgi:hypothetical protein